MVMKVASQAETLSIPAGEFKAKCLKLMDEANVTQVSITITKRGKPVGRFVPMPAEEKPFRSIIGRSPNARILGDIMAPMDWGDPVEKWKRANGKDQRKKSK
jgi:prevent-host-death family protein